MAPNRQLISPVLADLRQDIAGAIPVELIQKWNEHDKSAHTHKKSLSHYERHGTVVSSDSAGLSKLTTQTPLLRVMQLVSQPKEVIFAYGTAVGGRAIGMWVADNTQMFYDHAVKPHMVIDAMIASQKDISKLTVQVGMGIHHGLFWEIGGGLYGAEAEKIEEAAENYTHGKQIVITDALMSKLPADYLSHLIKHETYSWAHILDYTHLQPSIQKSKLGVYPYPFDPEFFQLLQTKDLGVAADYGFVHARYAKTKCVVLVNIHHEPQSFLLDNLTMRVVANAIIRRESAEYDLDLISSNGDIAVFVGDSEEEVITFARDLREKGQARGIQMNVGLAKGEVLLFPLGKNSWQIAGGAVNVASKLAEDVGGVGSIMVDSSLTHPSLATAQKYETVVSKVVLNGVKI